MILQMLTWQLFKSEKCSIKPLYNYFISSNDFGFVAMKKQLLLYDGLCKVIP